MSLPFVGIPDGMVLHNGGVRCDMLFGPCSCGAWHGIRTEVTNGTEDIMRAYIFFLKKESKNESKSWV